MSENAKYETREGKFSLNKNKNKLDDGKAYPDVFGETIIKVDPEWKAGDLIKFKIAGWNSTSQAGNPYLSCTIQEKVEKEVEKTTADNSKDLF